MRWIIIFGIILLSESVFSQISDRYCRIAFSKIKKEYSIEPSFIESVPATKDLRIFTVKRNSSESDYLHICKAPAKFSTFIFYVLYNSDKKTIKQVSIIHYTENHGLKVKSRKWLANFVGLKAGELHYGKNVDAVSGSTISAKSIINKINSLSY